VKFVVFHSTVSKKDDAMEVEHLTHISTGKA
jgi:hypothetical protein